MPTFGGYSPFPLRFGGEKPIVETVQAGLDASRGTAYDVSTDSPVWVENNAIARTIADVWNTNELLSNQFQPSRMSVLLERWEAIYGILPSPTADASQRRAVIAERVSRTGTIPNNQVVIDRLNELLAPVTFDLVEVAPGDAGVIESWPGGWYVQSLGATAPACTFTGATASDVVVYFRINGGGALGVATFHGYYEIGGVRTLLTSETTSASFTIGTTIFSFGAGTYTTGDQYFANAYASGWSSSVAEVTVLATKPSSLSERDYFDLASRAVGLLDDYLPAWVRFHIARDGSVPGSFILDEIGNLDNQRLS